jgi:Mg-chelatase subunit ChlD
MLVVALAAVLSCTSYQGEAGGVETTDDANRTVDSSTPKPSEESSTAETAPASPDLPEPSETTASEEERSTEGADVAGGLRGTAAPAKKETPEFMTESGEEPGARSDSTGEPASVRTPTSSVPSSSGLKAGFADDNRQYGYFVGFLEEFYYVPHFDLPVSERIVLQVRDIDDKPVANARVSVYAGDTELTAGVTTADGGYQFNPSEHSPSVTDYRAAVRTAEGYEVSTDFSRSGERTVTLRIDSTRTIPEPIPLDILFILDTTGSMGEEIYRLRATIELIHLNLTGMSSKPAVRFGMVLYKDIGDEYDTRVVPLTADLEEFREALELVEASGGGDTPEDLQAALERTLKEIAWDPDGVRLGFIITDAPPHLNYGQEYTYVDASRDARSNGIKLFSVGTGGLPIEGEYVLRQISQYTGGKYIFLTYGETGESEGGAAGSVSHHTGANYQTDKLEAIIIRFAKEELSYLADQPLDEDDPYFQALKIAGEEREETLAKLFAMAVDQLTDYSTFAVGEGTVAAILPLEPASDELLLDAEYFTEQMILSISESGGVTLVERKNIQSVIDELEFQLSGLTDSGQVAEIGKLLNAQVLIAGKLYRPGDYELFLRMLRVETGEVLSVTKAVVDADLGISIQ